jgi:hypothetical protein
VINLKIRFRKKNSELDVLSKYISAYNALPLKRAKKQNCPCNASFEESRGGKQKKQKCAYNTSFEERGKSKTIIGWLIFNIIFLTLQQHTAKRYNAIEYSQIES